MEGAEESPQPSLEATAVSATAAPPSAEVEPEPGPCTVFMGGIPGHTPDTEFRAFAEKFGAVEAFKMVVKEGSRVGFAFVQYRSQDAADRIKRSNTLVFHGRKLTIGDARRKPSAPSTPGTAASPAPTATAVQPKCPVDVSVDAHHHHQHQQQQQQQQQPTQCNGDGGATVDVVVCFEEAVRSFMTFVPPQENDAANADTELPASGNPAEDHQSASSLAACGAAELPPTETTHPEAQLTEEDPRSPARAESPTHPAHACTLPDAATSCRHAPLRHRPAKLAPEHPPAHTPRSATEAARLPNRNKRQRPPDSPSPPPQRSVGPAPGADAAAPHLLGSAAPAMDEATLQLAMSWYHTGYWTGYHAAKVRRKRPAT